MARKRSAPKQHEETVREQGAKTEQKAGNAQKQANRRRRTCAGG
jgi:hypothetical protein